MAFMGTELTDIVCVTLFFKLDFRGQLCLLLLCQLLCCTTISLPVSGWKVKTPRLIALGDFILPTLAAGSEMATLTTMALYQLTQYLTWGSSHTPDFLSEYW